VNGRRGLRGRRRYSSYAPVHIGVKIGGRGRGDADDGLHDDVDMWEIRAVN